MKNKSCDCGITCSCKNCTWSPYALFFDILGNENRLFILEQLQDSPKNVSSLVTKTGLEQTHVSHALKQLEQHGFVTKKRRGKFVEYSFNRGTIGPLFKLIQAHVKKYCAKDRKRCICVKKENLRV